MTINNLLQDTEATNACADFRRTIGGRAPRQAYCWWQAAFVAFTYHEAGMTAMETKCFLYETVGLKYANIPSTLLNGAIVGIMPGTRREYTRSLPHLAQVCGLRNEIVESETGHRPPMSYRFENPAKARALLLTTFPELLPLFTELDRWARGRV
jgi:hypothetical protein